MLRMSAVFLAHFFDLAVETFRCQISFDTVPLTAHGAQVSL